MSKKIMTVLVGLCLLAGGGFFSYEGHRLTVSLFFHYLQGSGETVSLKLPSFLDKYCQEEGLSGTHSGPYGYAFGKLTCTKSGAYDLYDFGYEGRPSVCNKLKKLVNPANPSHFWWELMETPANAGRCLVGLGYGEPFEVHITK